jgi:phospholipase B1
MVAATWIVLLLVQTALGSAVTADEEAIAYQKLWASIWDTVRNDPELLEQYEERVEEQRLFPPSLDIPEFTCDVSKRAKKAETVHELTPGDVGVVAAVGDSITAAFGLAADSPAGLALETRGESWTIGGNEDIETVLTIPNILKEFNPDLFGASYSNPPPNCGLGNECSQLNRAVSGATNQGIPNQMQDVIDKMVEYDAEGAMSMEDDWKVVSIFIGGNDLCRVCTAPDRNSPETYVANIKEAVENLRANVPRALVNIIIMFDVSPINDMATDAKNYTNFCRNLHRSACGCAIDPEDPDLIPRTQMGYWELLEEWINVNGTYDDLDDFTVVIQPHMRDQEAPYDEEGYFDLSFFAPDCFHPNRKGHQSVALYLWNAMLTPVPDKPFEVPTGPDVELEIKCPTEEAPYIFTRQNSGVAKKPVTAN